MKDYTHFFFNFAVQVLAFIWKHSWRCAFSVLQLRLREMRFLNVEMRLLNVEIDEQISDKNWKHRHQIRISREHPSTLRKRIPTLRKRKTHVNIEIMHLQECFQQLGYQRGDFPEAERAAAETLALPLYAELTEEMQQQVVDAIRDYYSSK